MLVSIFTDASVCSDTHIAGWASWGKSNRGVVKKSGVLRLRSPSSTIAEMQAIMNGCYVAMNYGVAEPGDILLVQSDCLHALEILKKHGNIGSHCKTYINHKKTLSRCVDMLENLMKDNVSFRFRHVKGHTRHSDPRFAVNRDVDVRARQAMQRHRYSQRKDLEKVNQLGTGLAC